MEFIKRLIDNIFGIVIHLTVKVIWLVKIIGELASELSSVAGPLLTQAIPAVFSYNHLISEFGFSSLFAFVAAAAIEMLGLATGSTFIGLVMFNKKTRAKGKRVDWWVFAWAGGSAVWYVMTLVALNVLMTNVAYLTGNNDGVSFTLQVGVTSLLVLLSIPAITIQSVRNMNSEIVSEVLNTDNLIAILQSVPANTGNIPAPTDPQRKWSTYTEEEIKFLGATGTTAQDVFKRFNIPIEASSNRKHRARARKEIND